MLVMKIYVLRVKSQECRLVHNQRIKRDRSIIRAMVISLFRRVLLMIMIYHMSKTQSQCFRGFHGFQRRQVADPDSGRCKDS
jgi:hypothetical protein